MSSVARQLVGGLTRVLQASSQAAETWFVLVVDEHAKSVLRHVLNAQALLLRNIALVIGLEDKRQPIPTACAVYLCCPTPKNLGIFHSHIKAGYYNSYEFIACSGPTQLHQLAYTEFRADLLSGKQISRLVEYPMSLYMVCDDMYKATGDSKDPIKMGVGALYSYVAAFSRGDDASNRVLRVPYIYTCGRKAKQLVLAFFEELQANNIGSERLSGHVLLLADREADPLPLFYHPYTYAGLVDDMGLFMGGDTDKKDEPPLGLGPAFQDPIFKSIYTKHFTAATEEVNKLLRELSSEYQAASEAKGNYTRILSNVDSMKTKKANCERHTNICDRILKYIMKESIKAYIDTEQESLSGQRKSLQALPSAVAATRSEPLTKEDEEHLIRTALCVLLGSQDNLDALVNGVFSKLKDLVDLLSAASGVSTADLQNMLQAYALQIRDSGITGRPTSEQQERSGQRQAVDAFVDVALALAKKGLDALMSKQTSLISLLLSLIVPATTSEPRYPSYYSLEAYGDEFHGLANTAGLFIVGEGRVEEACRLSLEVQQAFQENQKDAPRVTYGCTGLPIKQTAALSRLTKRTV